MIVYPDTSLIVALFTDDVQTPKASAWLVEHDPDFVFSTWTLAEFASALNLQRRQGRLDDAGAERAEHLLAPLTAAPTALVPTLPDDVVRTREVVRRLGFLRAPDALHLIVCQRIGAAMASLDGKLNEGADALGIPRALP